MALRKYDRRSPPGPTEVHPIWLPGVVDVQVYEDSAGPAEATVSAIANRWGFLHHSNFSTLYLRTYGHSPSITLRS